mgnify:CR=1 FL=1
MLQSSKAQLFFICVITALLFPIIMFSPSNVPRIIFALPVIFLFPGYTLLLTLFPRKGDLSGIERLLLSLALSLAIIPLILFILNFVWSLALYPSLISLTLFILAMSAIAWWRQHKLPEEARFAIDFRSPHIKGNYRLILWSLLIALTIAILLFPARFTLDPYPIEALHIFSNFSLFAALFYSWMSLLLFLFFFKRGSTGSNWEKLALACILVLVFVGFWIRMTPYDLGADGLVALGDVRYLQEMGRIPAGPSGYFEFPGLALFGNCLAQITNLDHFAMGQLARIFTNLLFGALLYLFYANSLRNARFAPGAILLMAIAGGALAVAGVISRSISFRPELLGGIFFLALLVILTRDEHEPLKTMSDRLLAIILLAAVTITYFGYSMCFFFALLGIYLVQRWGREKPLDISMLLLFLVVFLSWEIYSAVRLFNTVVGFLPMVAEHLAMGEAWLPLAQSAAGTVGREAPLWVTATSYLRWIFFGFGTVLGLIRLAWAKKLSSLERREIGGLLGILFFALFAAIVSPKGLQLTRYTWYAPIFLAPIIVRFFIGFSERWRKLSLILLLALLLTFSLPTFLVYYGSASASYAISPQDIGAGEFLQSRYGKGDGLCIFTNRLWGPEVSHYYLPDAIKKGPSEPYLLEKEDTLWENMDDLVKDFKNSGNDSVFFSSLKVQMRTVIPGFSSNLLCWLHLITFSN